MLISQKVLFSKEECDSIIKLEKMNHQSWKNIDREYKSCTIVFNDTTSWIFERLKTFFEESTNYSILKLKEEIHFHIFNTENWFGIHNDTRNNRLFSIGVLLNNNFDGGDFKLYNPDEIIINKIPGNSYIFDVSISHEITQIQLGIRYSLIWFMDNNNIKTISNKLM